MPPLGPLPPGDDVYRAASNRLWFDGAVGKFLPDAFKLRKRDVDNNSGLSVIVLGHCPTLEEAAELSHRQGIRAVCSLNVGEIRDLALGLEVIQDTSDHANVMGLPFVFDETDLSAIHRVNDCAEALAGISLICRL